MVELAVIVATIAAKVASYTIGPIGRYIVRPIASRCPLKNLWEYKSNLENMKTKLKSLEAERERVHGLTNVGVEPLPDISDWLDKATNIINEVSGLISEDNPERGCCERCNYSNLKESYQHRNNVARKLKDVAQLLQEALRSISLWEYKSNLENLKKEVEKLEAKRDSVKRSIKAGEEPLPDVKLWQDNVNSIINEVSGLTSQHNHQQQNYVARILNKVAQLLQEVREFKKLSFQPIPEETWLQSSEGYKAFESRTSILKEIVEALSKPDVNLVGIYGMGGIGKTTLSKQVARQTIQDKVFNKIVFVEVSQTPNIKKIQREIGSKLGLDFREEEELSERARRLYQQMKDEEKTLLILDNVWESLNFETMGIPYKHDSKGLKLLMTARKINVLTDGIENSQHNFSVEALEWEDAWSLFKSQAGTCVDRRDLLPIAVDVAKECGGVPIAIVTIAKALNNKETYEWRKVLRELRNPSPDSFDGIAANVYRSIELSYNYLETEELKATFLLCGSMGSSYDASIEDLLRYGIGLGLFNRFNTMEEERDNVCSLISTLKASSLLVDAPKKEEFFYNQLSDIDRFAMHDIVCDIARLIAYKDKNVFNVIDNVIPRSWESENMLTNCTSITLDNISELSKDLQLVCPQLKFLYVKPKFFDAQISDKFFACMPKLQVLHLLEMDLLQLSTPFSDLVNLQTLCLEYCELKDIADVGELKNLEIFSFRGCNGFQLSEKLHQLTKLRLLELDSIGLSSIPSKFILSFKKLEALYMRGTTIEWEAEKSNNGSRNTSLDELEHLSNLSSLEIFVPEAIKLRGLLSPKLERYNITIGENRLTSSPDDWSENCWDWYIRCKTSRFLQVKLNTNEDGIISGLKAIRQLVFDEVPGIADNFCGLDRIGFPELEDLKVQNNSHILHIVDTVSCEDVFPILKSLILWNLINLRTVCNGPLGVKIFHQLRTIKVGKCIESINIFSLANDRVFQALEEIEVFECWSMEEIFAISDQVHEIKCSKLRNLRLVSLPRLESFCCNLKTTTPILQLTSDTKPREIILEEEQDVPKPLFNEKVVVTNLETLEINDINVNSIWDNRLPTMASIPNLTCLTISNLANLRRLGTEDYIKFPLLRIIRIENCPKFKEIFFDDKVGVPSLEDINISKMYNLKMIWHNQLVEDSFPKLRSLRVEKCWKLSTLFRSNMCGRFLSLETLCVSECHSLKEILDLREINSEESHPTTSTQSRELRTYSSIVLSFANLQFWEVSKCGSMKTIVAKEEVEAKEVPKTARFVFPKLTFLELSDLRALETFYPGRYTAECPVLKTLKINQYGTYEYTEMMTVNQNIFLLSKVHFEFQVQKIWPNLLPIRSSWVRELTMLILHGCDNLEELFSYSMVVTEELREKKTENIIVFPTLKYLEMNQLANLKGLCSGCYIEFLTLKGFKISNCPVLTAFIFDDKVKVPSLKNVKISSMGKLTKIWDDQLAENFVPKLKSLQVERCPKLLILLPSDMCESFLCLETLNVSDCGSLEKIFDLHEINSKERHSTTSTQFKELYTTVLSFVNLQNLKVSNCGSLKSLFSVSNVANDRGAAEEMHATARFVFPKLTSLELLLLREFRTFYPGRYTMECPVLKTWKMYQSGIHSYTAMKKLEKRRYEICGNCEQIPKTMIGFEHSILWHDKVDFDFQVQKIWPNLLPIMSSWAQNLNRLILHCCDNLEELFPYSMVATEESREKKIGKTIVFPMLNYLQIKRLANLKGLCSKCHIEFPTLEEFKISNCPELTAFIFDDKVKVPSLKKVKISSMDKLTKIWDNQFAKNFIPKLKSLQVKRCQKLLTLLPSDMYESFSSLETLNVSDCGSLEKIFDLHEINSEERYSTTSTLARELYTTALSFANLQNLIVSECGNLKSLFSVLNVVKDRGAAEETLAIARFVFPKLTFLELYKLPELRTFYPARYIVEWPALRSLKVCDYGISDTEENKSMQQLFPHRDRFANLCKMDGHIERIWLWLLPMMSSSFQNLKELVIYECGNLKELFPTSNLVEEKLREKEIGNTISFPRLECLVMEYLANLTRLCSEYYNIKFPILKECKIRHCPELKAFIFDHKVQVPSLEKVKISSMDKLTKIWDNQFAENFIPKLKSLQVKRCQKLLTLLPSDMCESLSKLETLNVSNCGSLEKIFDLYEINSEERYSTASTQSKELYTTVLSFANLQNLKISECGSLKSFFSVSNIANDKGVAEETHATARFVFPKLTLLELYKLPELRTFYPTRYTVEWPVLISLELCDCGISEINIEERHSMTSTQSQELYTTVLSFANLQNLKVSKCGSLKSLFSVLNVAKNGEVVDCGSQGKIFELHETNSEERHSTTSTQSKELYTIVLSFANLQNLKVSECASLKSLFSVSNVAKERGVAEEMDATTRFVFPKLTSLELCKLPELRTFYPARYTVEWLALRSLKLCDCGISETDEHNSLQRCLFRQTDQFSILQNTDGLKIYIRRIWFWLRPIMSSSFQNLKELVIYNCGNLKELFPSCNPVEEELREKEMGTTISFPMLEYLNMGNLANLTKLCSGYYNIEFPSLKECKINQCPKLEAFIFNHKVKVPSLKNVNISYMDKLTKVWDNQLDENSIPKLESLQVYGCHKVLILVPLDKCESLSSLETLNVSDCGSLEKIFDLHEINSEERHSTASTQSKKLYTTVLSFANLQNLKVSECGSLKSLFSVPNVAKDREAAEETHATARFVFPKLTSLVLYNLPELRTFYPARYTVEWPVLRWLGLRDCGISKTDENNLLQRWSCSCMDKFSSEFSSLWNMDGLEIHVERIWQRLLLMMYSSFQNLTKLVVYDCGNLVELFPSSNLVEEEFSEKIMGNTILFPKLECLDMENLANLTRLCSGYYTIEFPSLKECKINLCPKLEAFIFDHKVKVPSLKNVKISSMDNLMKIWDNQLIENSIPKLESLQVYRCHKVLTLLPSDNYESLSSLETINVSGCDSLEKIFDLHETNSEERHSTTSTQSKELYTTVLSFANLQNLKVSECRSLKSLFSILNVAKNRGATRETQPIARFVFPKLTSLELYNLPEFRTFYPGRYTVEWPVLRRLQLCDGISDTDDEDQMQNSLFSVEKAISSLGELMLSGRQLMMMWQGQDPEPLLRNFKVLAVLDQSIADHLLNADQPVLRYIGDVKYMWKQNFKLDLILPNFENIRVGRCDNFISLMPPSASFQNLTSLEVYECDSLEHIGTFFMAKNLVKLEHLRIHRCKKIVEILGNHGDVTGDKILFSNLKSLSLENLPSLTSFCTQNFTLEFPSLEKLNVYICRNMKIFSQGDLTTPKLLEVKIDFKSVELCPDVDVNTAIQQFHEQYTVED